jgi:hypothetical protein
MQPQSLNKWQLLHTYQNVRGFIRCPDDDYPYFAMLKDDPENPVLHCTYCQANVRFGSDVWDQILEAVQEFYPDVTLEA